jgi:predicted negative regulator of RcsB-dependent stress response
MMTHYQTEEQQLEAIRSFAKKNQDTIMIIFILLACLFGGYKYWQWHQIKTKTEASNLYESLMFAAAQDKTEEIHGYADRLIHSYASTVYAQAATLLLAKNDVKEAQFEKAKQKLDSVIKHAPVRALQQIARIRLARLLMSEKNYPQALNILSEKVDAHYDAVINELEGDIYTAQHQITRAKQSYEDALRIGKQKGMENKILEMKLKKTIVS